MVGAELVGKSTSRAGWRTSSTIFESECHGAMYDNTRPQAFWLFAVNACGAYGFDGVKIIHSGFSDSSQSCYSGLESDCGDRVVVAECSCAARR
jgi:hypothetical protein